MEKPKFKINDERLWHYRCHCIRVVDGDTIKVIVDKGFGDYRVENLRVYGIDTPELRPRKGTPEERSIEKIKAKAAKVRVEELVLGRDLIIKTHKTGKFGRWLAEVFLDESTMDAVTKLGVVADGWKGTLSETLLAEGHAVEYLK